MLNERGGYNLVWGHISPISQPPFPLQVIIPRSLITFIAIESVKKNAICLKLFWYNVFVHRKLKLVNFLVDVNLKTIWVRVCTVSEWSRYATVFCRWEHENVLRMLLNIKCVGVIIRIKSKAFV